MKWFLIVMFLMISFPAFSNKITTCKNTCIEQVDFVNMSLIEEVHILAKTYGWTEKEVLQIPKKRRLKYISLVYFDEYKKCIKECVKGTK
jgi:hypothetical protein